MRLDIFVLDNIFPENINCFCVIFILFLTYNKMFLTITHLLFLCINNLLQYVAMRSDIFVLANIFPANIYCFCVTFILFLIYNKMLIFDQFYCYVNGACIFLFSTIIQTVCQLCLYISVLNKKLPDTNNCNSLIKLIVLSFLHVCFCSQL